MAKEQNPEPKFRAMSTPPSAESQSTAEHRQRRELLRRRLNLECGCWESCQCEYKRKPTPKRVEAYREAVEHLERHKLLPAALTAECRELWRLGGSDRRVAETVVTGWSS